MATNWALASNGGTASATNFLDAPLSPDKSIDGNIATWYHSATQSAITLEIDLGQNRNIDQIKLRTSRTDAGYTFGYSLDYWNGSAWVNIITGQSTTVGFDLDFTHNFSQVTGSKVRLVTTGAQYTTITEFQVWGDPPDSTPPSNVTLGSATALTPTSARFAFTPATDNIGVTGLNWEYDTVNTFNSGNLIQEFVASNTSPRDKTGLLAGRRWYARAKAYDGYNLSLNWSNIVDVDLAPTITTTSPLNNAIIATAFSQTLTKIGDDGTWSIQSGAPSGMSINSSTGQISWSNPTPLGTISNIVTRYTITSSGLSAEVIYSITVTTVSLESEYTPASGLEAPETLTFNDVSSGTVTDQRISFGDFTERIQANDADFSHTYLAPGTYKFERWAKIGGVDAYETYEINIGGTPIDDGLVTFDEVEIPRQYLQGVTGGPAFLTSILGNPLGQQQRDISREDAIWEFQFGYKQTEETLKGILDFFMTRQGQAIGFRLFSPYDNSWNNEQIALTATATATYKLIRTYKKAGRIYTRRIIKPVPDLVITINGNPATTYSTYSVNYATGEITFTTPASLPVNGILRVTGFYCIPVFFKTDGYLPTNFDHGHSIFQELNLTAIEILPIAFGID